MVVEVAQFKDVTVAHVTQVDEALLYLSKGFEPVECAFGDRSIVGVLGMDHHGCNADNLPVSIRAAHMAFAPAYIALAKMFVVTGAADPDALYAMLALSQRIYPELAIAQAISNLDLDPIGYDRTKRPYTRNSAFDMLYIPQGGVQGYVQGLEVGESVFNQPPLPADVLEQAIDFELRRRQLAPHEVVVRSDLVALAISDAPNRDIWHQSANAPVVVQFKPSEQVITVSGLSVRAGGLLNLPSVYDLFGDAGFRSGVYSHLRDGLGEGAGGRNDVGGSQRGLVRSFEDAHACVIGLESAVKASFRR